MPSQMLKQLSGPLGTGQADLIRTAVDDLSVDQLNWLSGYLAGIAAHKVSAELAVAQDVAPATDLVPDVSVTVLYGSQTGNSTGVARQLHGQMESAGCRVTLQSLANYNPRQLKKEQYVALVISTHGEGDPPDDALFFHEFLFGKKAPKLNDLKYSVLALGDSSYEKFCHTGKEFDERFSELGAERLHTRIDADVDYQAKAILWESQWRETAESLQPASQGSERPKLSVVSSAILQAPQWGKFEPFTASVLDSFRITGSDSGKVVQHVELSLEDSGLEYQPGDALGVWPENSDNLVAEVLEVTALDGDSRVDVDDDQISLKEALTQRKELTQVHPGLVEYLASSNDLLQGLVAGERRELLDYIRQKQVVELLSLALRIWFAQELVDQLRNLTPRLYSIASSAEAVGEEVHLTVGLVSEERESVGRYGAASHFLTQLTGDASVRVFVEPNRNFKLPEKDETPVIMVGPGTGIAPFRSFMQQREATAATGDNWLLFGNPHFNSDFLYQTEWQAWRKSGLLSRIDLAFSRDQNEKIYVQGRMAENAVELFQWLERGAHFYVCGDQQRMAKSVDETLHKIVAEQSGQGEGFASDYVQRLKREGRYQRDTY